MTYDVAGLGNALVDALVVLEDDDVLNQFGLQKGMMQPVQDSKWREIYDAIKHHDVVLDAGGSCANAVATAALLGAKTIYCGRLGDDDLGKMYTERMVEACGGHGLQVAPDLPTGKCLSMISADAERTLVTDLGAATSLPNMDEFKSLISRSKVSHFTGYTLFDDEVRVAVEDAMVHARSVGSKVSLDAADPLVVKLHKDLLWHLIESHCDLVFLNAEEAQMLTDAPAEEAARVICERSNIHTAVVKLGSKGSIIRTNNEDHRISIDPVKAVDTTGAGDSYAGGFLYAYVNGWSPRRSGSLASSVASKAVQQVGARVRSRKVLTDLANHHLTA